MYGLSIFLEQALCLFVFAFFLFFFSWIRIFVFVRYTDLTEIVVVSW